MTFRGKHPKATITFNRDGILMGELDLDAKPPTFRGDVDESAKVFFDNVIKLALDYKENGNK